jgi:hypothetical protein
MTYSPPDNDSVDFQAARSSYSAPGNDTVDLRVPATKLGEIGVETEDGTIYLPVYQTGHSNNNIREFLRINTPDGKGFIPVTDTDNAAHPELRIYSENHGIQAFHDSAR